MKTADRMMGEVIANLKAVRDKIIAASAARTQDLRYYEPRLVAVSKLKPPQLILAAYEAGQRHFGENYVNELLEKGNNSKILEKCQDIKWHFIGHLQRNKVNKVVSVPNLYMIETIDSDKIASALNNSWAKFRREADAKLKVMVQVNTSKEEEKNGCEIQQVTPLVKYIMDNCENLEFIGLMTIGKYGFDPKTGPNPDFVCLSKCRNDVSMDLGIDTKCIELSMGMSNDFEQAIEMGSTSVRVGSSIFGERPKKNA